ncbi:MAG: L-histidine N(alpha)-methyltransferase [Microcystaceae cyanobacterium]
MKPNFETVFVHSSQFPDQVYRDYLACFFEKKINSKFHYDSVKQSQKWVKVHQHFSPAQTDDSCINAYHLCFQQVAQIIEVVDNIQLISLGCGEGSKDHSLLSCLANSPKNLSHLSYYAIDVSLSLSLMATQKVRNTFPELAIQPIICDLLQAKDLMLNIPKMSESTKRIITFFGMIPNFYPDEILPILSQMVESGDLLIFSANLAHGNDYVQGVNQVLPQYDNELTKDWLITLLVDAGVNTSAGQIKFQIEADETDSDLKRIAAYFELEDDVCFSLENKLIEWYKGERIKLFFSYRYTTDMITKLLQKYQIKVLAHWEANNQEEGVYLCHKI